MRYSLLFLTASILFSNNQIPGDNQKRPILLRGGTLYTVSGDILEEYDLDYDKQDVRSDDFIQKSVDLKTNLTITQQEGSFIFCVLLDAPGVPHETMTRNAPEHNKQKQE